MASVKPSSTRRKLAKLNKPGAANAVWHSRGASK
jgi:hypothetical protein